MKQLLVDFGNTRIKWTINAEPFVQHWCYVGEISKIIEFITQQNIYSIAIAITKKTHDFTTLLEFISQHKLNKIEISINPKLLKPNYLQLDSFGIDRYLSMLGAKSITVEAFCVIDAGTALTVDFYDTRNQLHLGGMISAGIGLQRELLFQKSGLKLVNNSKLLLGNDTQSSLNVGIFHGAQYLLNGLINDVEKNYNINFSRFYTGGDANLIIENQQTIIENLVFIGMKTYLSSLKTL